MTYNFEQELKEYLEGSTLEGIDRLIGIIKPFYKKQAEEGKHIIKQPKYIIKNNFKKYINSLETEREVYRNRLSNQ